MSAVDALSMSPTAAAVLTHLVRARNADRISGATSMAKNKDIARAIRKSPSSVNAALGDLAKRGLVTYAGGPAQLREDAALLPTICDAVFIAEGEPLPPDVVDATWLHPMESVGHDVEVPYLGSGDPAEAAAELCGPTLEASRRAVLEEWRAAIAARPALAAVCDIYGRRSESGTVAATIHKDLLDASAWLHQATTEASSQGRERLTGHEWAVHEILLDRAVSATRDFIGDGGGTPLLGLYKSLWTLVEDEPDEPAFRKWMQRHLRVHLP